MEEVGVLMPWASIILYAAMLFFVLIGIGKVKGVRALLVKLGFKEVNLRKNIIISVLFLAVLFGVSMAVELVMYSLGFGQDANIVSNVLSKTDLAPLLVIIVVAPFVEEIFFRGYLQRKTNLWFASFIFAYFHIIYGSLTELIGAFLLGLILGKEYEYTGDLFAPTFSHFFYNLVIVFFLFIG